MSIENVFQLDQYDFAYTEVSFWNKLYGSQ